MFICSNLQGSARGLLQEVRGVRRAEAVLLQCLLLPHRERLGAAGARVRHQARQEKGRFRPLPEEGQRREEEYDGTNSLLFVQRGLSVTVITSVTYFC